jgi:hypothetical protein
MSRFSARANLTMEISQHFPGSNDQPGKRGSVAIPGPGVKFSARRQGDRSGRLADLGAKCGGDPRRSSQLASRWGAGATPREAWYTGRGMDP